MLFYTGSAFPEWKGSLINGGLVTGSIVRLELDGTRVVHEERLLGGLGQRIRTVIQGNEGDLYLLTDESNGEILRISPAEG